MPETHLVQAPASAQPISSPARAVEPLPPPPRTPARRRLRAWVLSPAAPLAALGFVLVVVAWYLAVDVLELWRFRALPSPVDVYREWTSRHPVYGTSLYTSAYYDDIWASVRRVLESFALATLLGVPLGLLLGWSLRVREHVFPVLELVRPIPILAWVPLAILMFHGTEAPVVFLTFLAAFYATTLNAMLGARSVDRDLVRAARCLGARPVDVFRTVIVPGALPAVFTGLQVAMGVAWFSLVAGEMVAGRFGLGYLINSSYVTLRYPTIVIAMLTLGLVGFASSALVRLVGNRLMAYRTKGGVA
jgi:NitT/TauT family transport system permease protein